MNLKATIITVALSSAALFVVAGCDSSRTGSSVPKTAPAVQSSAPEGQKTALQTVCPVMGGEVNRTIYADHNGKRVYFCCAGCIGQFNSEPEKFIQKLIDSKQAVEDIPKG